MRAHINHANYVATYLRLDLFNTHKRSVHSDEAIYTNYTYTRSVIVLAYTLGFVSVPTYESNLRWIIMTACKIHPWSRVHMT